MSLECDMELDILKLQIGKIKQVFRLMSLERDMELDILKLQIGKIKQYSEPKTQCDQ